MPELPEVETIRRGIVERIGVRITSVDVRRSDVVVGLRGSHAETKRALLDGTEIHALHRRGKQLAMEAASGRVVLVQLGMSGQLCTHSEDARLAPHTHVVWTFADGKRMTFRDPRRFGGLTILESKAALDAHWADLGPDALDVDAPTLVRACKGTRRAAKAVLLDQQVLAGVGNIYADESLFLAGIRPRRSARTLTRHKLELLASSVRSVLAEAVTAQGSTLRDYRKADGLPGEAQSKHRVYGRGGKPCFTCGTKLRRLQVAQRTTVYCPVCQH